MRENNDDYTINTPYEVVRGDLRTPVEDEIVLHEDTPQELDGGDIVVNDVDSEEETPKSLNASRIARAVQVVDGVVTNVILVGVDADDKPVGFETPYGTETIVVPDDSPTSIGWYRIDDDFVNPNE